MDAPSSRSNGTSEHRFRERFESLRPPFRRVGLIGHTLRHPGEHLRQRLIENTGLTEGVREWLEELMQAAEEHGRSLADNLDPSSSSWSSC